MKKGFTLVEMLVVIGILGILLGVLVSNFGGATQQAEIAKGSELVSNVQTALVSMYTHDGRWPESIVNGNGANENRLGPEPGAAVARKGGLSLSYNTNSEGKYVLTGFDKFGVLDPWGQEVMKRNQSANLSTPVPQGGTINDHIIRYAIDEEGTGITTATVCGKTIRVRAEAIVWSCGPDGVFDDLSKMGRSDDIFSFTKGQIIQ